MSDVARKSFIATWSPSPWSRRALAIWHLKVLVALLLLAIIIASAMRPGDRVAKRTPRPAPLGVAIHYVGFVCAIGLLLWLIVPRALDQIEKASARCRPRSADVAEAARHSHGIKHEILVGIQHRLERLPNGTGPDPSRRHLRPDRSRGARRDLLHVRIAAYWIFEKERAQEALAGLAKTAQAEDDRRRHWDLIEAKLGGYVRGSLLMVTFVSTVLSLAFWLIGVPFWLLIGVFAGIVELVPVIGPLVAGLVAIGAGLTVSWQTAAAAARRRLRPAAAPGLRDRADESSGTQSASRR